MVEFIVLGQVPGTNIYLSFGTTVAAAAIVTALGFLLYNKRSAFIRKQADIASKTI